MAINPFYVKIYYNPLTEEYYILYYYNSDLRYDQTLKDIPIIEIHKWISSSK